MVQVDIDVPHSFELFDFERGHGIYWVIELRGGGVQATLRWQLMLLVKIDNLDWFLATNTGVVVGDSLYRYLALDPKYI